MAEPNSGGTSGGPGKPKELSMELRLLIAFVLMGVVLFVTPYFYKTVAPPPKKTAPLSVKGETAPPPPAAATTAEAAAASDPDTSAAAAPAVAAQKEEISTIDTDFFQIAFSN